MVLPINSKNENKLSSVLKKPVICNLQNSNVYKPPIYVLYNLQIINFTITKWITDLQLQNGIN